MSSESAQRLSFKEAVHQFEAKLISDALEESDGQITKASRLLGFAHHQSLICLLDRRHKSLRPTPKRKRKHRKAQGQWEKEAL